MSSLGSSASIAAILVVGATGNTGKGVVTRLSELLSSVSTFTLSSQQYQILALTRSASGTSAKQLSALPHVKVIEADWITMKADFLTQHNVQRVYIAPHNLPDQFVDESSFVLACLQAKVRYLVKLSTLPNYVRPDSSVYYGRSHWAVEQLLSSPELSALPFTVLRANYFLPYIVGPVVQLLRARPSAPAPLMLKEDTPVALVDPAEVGAVAANLLALSNPSSHFSRIYCVSGPEDVTGRQVVQLLQARLGNEIKVECGSAKLFEDAIKSSDCGYPAKVHEALLSGRHSMWGGQASLEAAPTNVEVLELAPPRMTVAHFLDDALQQERKDKISK